MTENNKVEDVKINVDGSSELSPTISGIPFGQEKKSVHPMRRLRKRNIVKMTAQEQKLREEEDRKKIEAFMQKNDVTKCKPMWARGSVNSNTIPLGD